MVWVCCPLAVYSYDRGLDVYAKVWFGCFYVIIEVLGVFQRLCVGSRTVMTEVLGVYIRVCVENRNYIIEGSWCVPKDGSGTKMLLLRCLVCTFNLCFGYKAAQITSLASSGL